MAQRITDDIWEIQGRTVTLPVAIRHSTFAAAVFCCSATAIRAAVPDDRLQPFTVVGRGMAVVIFVRYHDSDLDSYDEVGILVAVRGPGGGTIGAYTVELPVTEAFTREAGCAIWGLPKWLARAAVVFRRRGMQVRLCDGDRFVLTAALDVGRLRIPVPLTVPVPCWAVRPDGPEAGELLHGVFRLRLEGLRLRLGGARLVLGDHRMARTARALGMSRRPLCTTVAPMTAELGAFTPVRC